MKKSDVTDEQIVAALKEAEAGGKVQEICKKLGISDTTFYKWRAKFRPKEVADMQRLKQLEEENQRLKAIVADLTLRNHALKRVVTKKW